MGEDDSRMSAHERWSSVPPRDRRRIVAATAARGIVAAVGLLIAYYLTPFGPTDGERLLLRAAIGGLIVLLVLAVQIRGVATADYPMMRAIEGLALGVPLVILLFAATYLTLSASNAAAFSEELDHTGALYFAVTTSATVGFGDIAARTDAARIVVMVHMLATVVVLGVTVRIMLGSAKRRAGSGS